MTCSLPSSTSSLVSHVGSELFGQDGILPFIESIESDLKQVREMCKQGREVSHMQSYTCLMANYGGMMALPTDPSYCLMYPTVYTTGSPLGLCTKACVCHSLLHLMDMDPMNRQQFKGSCLLVLHGAQYKNLFPIITEPCNHRGLLIDLNTEQPYPMEVVGNFCLEDTFLPGCPGDSLLFHDDELAELAKQGFCIPTYKVKARESAGGSKTHQSPHSKEHSQKPPHKDEGSSKQSSKSSGTSSPRAPNSMSTSKFSDKSKLSPPSKEQKEKCDWEKHSPQVKEWKDKCDHEDCNVSTQSKESSHSEKDNRWGSNKDSSSSTSQVSCKCHPSSCSSSLEHGRKKACINSSTHSSSESSRAQQLSPTRSMSDYDEHSYFMMLKFTSTPHKSDHQPCNRFTSTESRCSWPPLDSSIYNNFCYRGHAAFGRGRVESPLEV